MLDTVCIYIAMMLSQKKSVKKGTGPNEGMGPEERNKHRKEQKE